jgi:PKD repeat protein
MKVTMDCGGKIINITKAAMITDSEHKISIECTSVNVEGTSPFTALFKMNSMISKSELKKIEWKFGGDSDFWISKELSYTYVRIGIHTVASLIATKTFCKEYPANFAKITVASITSETVHFEAEVIDASSHTPSCTWFICKIDSGSRVLREELTDRDIIYVIQNAGLYETELIAKNTEAITVVLAPTATSISIVITTPAVTFPVIKTVLLIDDNCLVHRPNEHHRKIHVSVINHVNSEKLFSYPVK